MIADFLSLLGRTSVIFSAALLLVFALRPLVRSLAGARVAYLLWLLPVAAIVAATLPAPVTPMMPPPRDSLMRAATPLVAAVAALPQRLSAAADDTLALPLRTDLWLLTAWLIGAVASLGLLASRQRRFVSGIGPLRKQDGPLPLFVADTPDGGPALVGALRPRLVVPSDFEERYTAEEWTLVIAHEQTHLRRGDPALNAIVALLRCAFWFNPLVYFASSAVRLDQELACDEATIAAFPQSRLSYAHAMLKTQLPIRPIPLGCYWPAIGRHPLTRRIALLQRQVSTLRRGAGLVTIAAIIGGSSYVAWAFQSTPAQAQAIARAAQVVALPAFPSRFSAAADVNEVRLGDGTPLIEAARAGQLARVQELLDRGADPDLASPRDGNPLIMAAARGHAEVVRLLVERGANVNGYVPGDETPLINAAGRGHLPVVQYLVEQGADVNLAFDVPAFANLAVERRSPLGQALRNRHAEVVRYLQAAGAHR